MLILHTYKRSGLTIYGYLYNWWAANEDINGDNIAETSIASTGWHLPSRTQWQTLETYLGGSTVAGGKLKETGFTYWNSPNTGATNEVGFNARGGGERRTSFQSFKNTTRPWTSDYSSGNGWEQQIGASFASTNLSLANKYFGQAVRLLKDTTTLLDGETGTYVGNDGKSYPTICIGTQEWLAHDLEETKYRDGSSITLIGNTAGDDIIWQGLTTAAYCVPVRV